MTLLEKILINRLWSELLGWDMLGLPLVLRFGEVGFKILGFDSDAQKVEKLNRGESYIKHISSEGIAKLRQSRQFEATADMQRLSEPDALLICVPTPLDTNREPDLKYVVDTTKLIAAAMRPGQLISLESTTYPGTTDGVMLPLLPKNLQVGKDYYLVYSPEREDPGNKQFEVRTIPKVVGGMTPACLEHGVALVFSNY